MSIRSCAYLCLPNHSDDPFSVRMLREELQLLQEQGSYVGEVVKPMDKKKVLVKVFMLFLEVTLKHTSYNSIQDTVLEK